MNKHNDKSDASADAEALYDAVSQLVRVHQLRDRDRICCYDVSVTQCHALEALVRRGPLRLQALAEELLLDKSTASRVVEALVQKRYVHRVDDPEDRRAVRIEVTAAGRALSARIRADLVAEDQAALGDLPPEVRAGALQVLRRLARAAEAGTSPIGCCRPSGE